MAYFNVKTETAIKLEKPISLIKQESERNVRFTSTSGLNRGSSLGLMVENGKRNKGRKWRR